MSTKGTESGQKALCCRGPARAGKKEGARKRTRLASSFPNAGKSAGLKKTSGKSFGHHGIIFTPDLIPRIWDEEKYQ